MVSVREKTAELGDRRAVPARVDLAVQRRAPAPTRPPSVTLDRRVAAALAVLAGDDVTDVAERFDLSIAQVLRYTEIFRAAGTAAVTGVAPSDEASLERYLGMLAHEMRAPLTAAQTWAGLLGTDAIDAGEQEGARQVVFSRLAQVKRLCDDLLDATALRLGRLRLRRRPLDFAATVQDVARALADDRIRVTVSGPAEVHGDPDRLDQVVTNLLGNALEHGRPGPVEVEVASRDSWVELTVRNAGPLRGPVDAEAIFDAYESGHTAGHGLGLYIAKSLVLAHGGRITVSDDGERTEFVLRLPVDGTPAGPFDVPALS